MPGPPPIKPEQDPDDKGPDTGPKDLETGPPVAVSLAARFTLSTNGFIVDFKDESIPEDKIISWEWRFGDGDISYDQNPSHDYSIFGEGEFEITLTVEDEDGNTDTYNQTIELTSDESEDDTITLKAYFEYSVDGNKVYFTDKSSPVDGIVIYRWDFGDGFTSDRRNPVHDFSSGTHNIQLEVTGYRGEAAVYNKYIAVGSIEDASGPEKDIDLPDVTTFFISGLTSSGKSVLLASLLYYIRKCRNDVRIDLKNNTDEYHEELGHLLFDTWYDNMDSGIYPLSTSPDIFPATFHFSLNYNDQANESVEFLFSDIAGEKWKTGDYEGRYVDLDEAIKKFIKSCTETGHPTGFIFILPADEKDNEHYKNTNRILSILDRMDLGDSDLLFVVTKWDLVSTDYENVEDYLLEKHRATYNLMHGFQNVNYTHFTIGKDLGAGRFSTNDYDTNSPKELLRWIQSVIYQMEIPPGDTQSSSFWNRFLKLFGIKRD